MCGLTRFNKAEPGKGRLIFYQLDAHLQLKTCIAQLPRPVTGVLDQEALHPRPPSCLCNGELAEIQAVCARGQKNAGGNWRAKAPDFASLAVLDHSLQCELSHERGRINPGFHIAETVLDQRPGSIKRGDFAGGKTAGEFHLGVNSCLMVAHRRFLLRRVWADHGLLLRTT